MTRHAKAQLHALDRIMYLLEEQSIKRLEMDSEDFADFIEQLYAKLDQQAASLKANHN